MIIETETLIVGSGAAGSSLGRILSTLKMNFLILENQNITDIQLNINHSIGSLEKTTSSSVRTVSGIGGGTNLWGGGLVELDKRDFIISNSHASLELYDNLEKNYEKAWQFFGFNERPPVKDKKGNDICYVQKKPVNFSNFINSKNFVHGEIVKIKKKKNLYKTIIIKNAQGSEISINFKHLVLANGTLGILGLINKFQKTFTELPLNLISTGIYTHPKCSLKDARLLSDAISSKYNNHNKFIIYKQLRFGNYNNKLHALRIENKFLYYLEKLENLSKKILKISFVKNNLSKLFQNFFMYLNQFNYLNLKNSIFKIFIDSLEPNFNIKYCSKSKDPILYFNSKSIDLNELNKSLHDCFGVKKRVELSDITSIHTHFMGGLKLKTNNKKFIDENAKVVESENLWIHGPILLNARGYANPVLSIVALSYIVYKSLKND